MIKYFKIAMIAISLFGATCLSAAEKKSIVEYFRLLPESAFDDTTEGLSSKEKVALLQNGESSTWKLQKLSESKALVTCKIPSSQVAISVKPLDGDVLEVLTQNQQVIKYAYWKLADDGKSLRSFYPDAITKAANETPDGSGGITLSTIPEDLKVHVRTLEQCLHWHGEEPYDAARAREIKKNIATLHCDSLPRAETALREKYKTNAKILGVLDRAKGNAGK